MYIARYCKKNCMLQLLNIGKKIKKRPQTLLISGTHISTNLTSLPRGTYKNTPSPTFPIQLSLRTMTSKSSSASDQQSKARHVTKTAL